MKATTVADGVTQIREFSYNHLGNLLSEKHPEKDGPVTYSDYDALGHAGRKIDGPSDLAFTWDRAERVTEIREGSGAERPLKSFEYSTTVAAGDWRKGKLQRATRYNYYLVDPPQPPDLIFADGFECGDTSAWNGGGGCPPAPIAYSVEVAETYVYGGIGGRVSQRDTAITLNGNTGETFTQGWSYNDLGDVATVDYPVCNFTRCTTDGGGLQRSVATTYTRGFPTAVPGYITSITYHPNHLVHKITHNNNVVVTQAADPNGMARPASIEAKKGTTTHWTTGTYQYDGASNISSIGDSDFVYDKVSRLTRAVVSKSNLGTGSLVQRDYTYDAFGNLQGIAGSPGRATPTDSATNRLHQGPATYSAAGSLTSWNGNTYEYDAFQMMTRMISGEENWLYVYTADDERIWQFRLSATLNFSRYTLRDLSAQVLREYAVTSDSWVVERDYVYAGGRLVAAETSAGVRHFHSDHLRTPRVITNGSGSREAFHTYFPFGEEASDPSQDEERLKFTGHERDLADSGGTGDDLDYMHARFCSPIAGRFLSSDPNPDSTRLEAPQTLNRYSYVLNNPVVLVDPTGEVAFVPIIIGLAVGGVLFGASAANAPESPDTEMIPSDDFVPLDVMAAEALLGPLGEVGAGFLGRFFGRFFRKAPRGSPIRARHFTSPERLDAIQAEGVVRMGRGGVVDVEVGPPFRSTRPGRGGPRRELGASREGAFVEFDLPAGARPTNVGPRNTASIPGDVELEPLNPVFEKVNFFERLLLDNQR